MKCKQLQNIPPSYIHSIKLTYKADQNANFRFIFFFSKQEYNLNSVNYFSTSMYKGWCLRSSHHTLHICFHSSCVSLKNEIMHILNNVINCTLCILYIINNQNIYQKQHIKFIFCLKLNLSFTDILIQERQITIFISIYTKHASKFLNTNH